jgi:Raf kinase inhibitor-like YbhB/YbcL family protein
MNIQISSEAFGDGQRVPTKYTQDGQNVSPPLSWKGVPEKTKELALIVEDPDAPREHPFVHWVVYKIPPGATGLREGVGHETRLKSPQGAVQGANSFKKIGYGGPAPPPGHGTHHYHFRLFALDEPLNLSGGLDSKALASAMSGHVLDQGEVIGTYDRS